MVDVVSSFPLLNLPNNALMKVLQTMGCLEQIGFSILSKRTRNLIKSLNLKAQSFSVIISGGVKISITFGYDHGIDCVFRAEEDLMIPAGNDMPLMKLPISCTVRVNYRREAQQESFIWNNPGFELKHWMDHLSTIFHHSEIEELRFIEGCKRFDIETICEPFNNCTGVWISVQCSDVYSQLVLKNFLPCKRLEFEKIPFQNINSFHHILHQSFDVFDFMCDPTFPNSPRFTLDELLMTNSSIVRAYDSNLTEKDINRFIKHWQNGSNPRMEYMEIEEFTDTILNKNIILNGIDHLIVSPDEKRIFKKTVQDWPSVYGIANSSFITKYQCDIIRKDGQKATIIAGIRNHPWTMLKMYVWQ